MGKVKIVQSGGGQKVKKSSTLLVYNQLAVTIMKVCSEHKRTVCRRINGARCDKESFLSVPQKMCPSAIFSLMQAILNSITFLQLCISQTIGNGKGYQTAANSVTVARGEDAEKERLNNGKY